jgi:UDP-2,4-diacetamido-2,4,6-trideoxy-beta-L-altropyranose hydrolase
VRADASTAIGTGHVMRTLALADAWQAAGGRVVLLSHCPALIAKRIEERGIAWVPLETPETSPTSLARRLTALLAHGTTPTWVALDGYGFDTACHRAVRGLGLRLLVFDDLMHLERYSADLLVNASPTATTLDYAYDEGAALLLGPRYVLLRSEFHPWIGRTRRLSPVARNVLVVLGGSDPANMSTVVLAGIAALNDRQLHTRLVIGPANPHGTALQRQASAMPGRVELVVNPADLSELMTWADVAVSAAGTTCGELAFLQLPTLAVVVADNQFHAAATFARAGTVEHLGRDEELTPQRVAEALGRLCGDFDRRLRMAAAGAQLVDGRGVQRLVATMRALDGPIADAQLELRPARPDDLLPLLRLANEPSVRRSSLNSAPISLEEHTAWYMQRLANPGVRMWVLEFQGLLLGHIRYVCEQPNLAEISLAVSPAFRRRGLARRLLATCATACQELRVARLRAVVRVENHASAATFQGVGFCHVETRPVHKHMCHIFEWSPA